MKTVVVALLVFLAVSQNEGLKCHCGGSRHCSNPIETCSGSDRVCFKLIIFAGSKPTYSKGCMSSMDCAIINQPGLASCSSCGFDLCNR